jgi:hypothetical protein
MLITIILAGGLANQLFTYAAVNTIIKDRRLSQASIHFDISELKSKYITPRDFMLSELDIPTSFGHNFFAPKFTEQQFNFSSALERFIIENYNKKTPEIVIKGHFISHKYLDLSKKHSEYYTDRLALHVRRGDYENKSSTRDYHGLIDYKDYYEKALEALGLPSNYPTDIYTDDVIQTAYDFGEFFNITVKKSDPISDFKNMSRHKYLVISNSSFSLMAAYKASKDTKVVCPDKFFKGANLNESDLRLPEWISLPVKFI